MSSETLKKVSHELILAHRQLSEKLLYAHYSLHATGIAEDEIDVGRGGEADPTRQVADIVVNDKNSELPPSKKLFLSTLELATFILTEYLDTDALSDGDVACPAFSVKKGCLDFFALFECVDTLFHQWGMRVHRREGEGEGEQHRLNNATEKIAVRPGGLICLCLPRPQLRSRWEVEEWAAFAIEHHLKTKWVGPSSNLQMVAIQDRTECDNFLFRHRSELLHLAHPCHLCRKTIASCQVAGIPNFDLGSVLHDASEGKRFRMSKTAKPGKAWNPSSLKFKENDVEELLKQINEAHPQEEDDTDEEDDDATSSSEGTRDSQSEGDDDEEVEDAPQEEEDDDDEEEHEDHQYDEDVMVKEHREEEEVATTACLPMIRDDATVISAPPAAPRGPFVELLCTISQIIVPHAVFSSSIEAAITASKELFHHVCFDAAKPIHPEAPSLSRRDFAFVLGVLFSATEDDATQLGSVLRFARLLAVHLNSLPDVDATKYVSELCSADDPLSALRNAVSPLLKRNDNATATAVAPPRGAFRFHSNDFPRNFADMCLSIPAVQGLGRHWHSNRQILGACNSFPLEGWKPPVSPASRVATATATAATLVTRDASPFALLFEHGHLLKSNTEIEVVAQKAVQIADAALYSDERNRVLALVSAAAAKALFTPTLMRTTKMFSWKSTIEAVRTATAAANDRVIVQEGTTLDPWQADVFNLVTEGIDSALVCAPTSSGKTFLSLLAMKHCVAQDPKAVVVYICPTKALANMVFDDLSESTPGGLVGIFTKENRKHMLTCRILVAVPATFMILLMSVENAEFRSRLRLVVFDEVHYICDEEAGPTIEQIFLMMCCQFIAFSATFNGADEFVDWLSFVQAKQRVKGMVRPPVVRKIVSTLRATEQIWVTAKEEHLHPWRLCSIKSIPDLLIVPDLNPSQLELTMRLLEESKLIWPLSVAYAVQQRKIGRQEAVLVQPTSNAKWFLRSLIREWMIMPSNERGQPDSLIRLPTRETIKFVDVTLRTLLIQLTTDESVLGEVNAHPLSRWRLAIDQILRLMSQFFKLLAMRTPAAWSGFFKVLDAVLHEESSNRYPCIVFTLSKNECVTNAIRSGKRFVLNKKVSLHHAAIRQECIHLDSEASRTEMERCLSNEDIAGLREALLVGMAAHHASLPAVYKSVVEKLFRQGKLRVVFATSTLAVGVHTPCRWVVIAVSKNDRNLDGALMTQMAGRAGRRGIEEEGFVTIRGCEEDKMRSLLRHSLPDFSKSLHFDVSFVMRSIAFLAGRRAVDGADMNEVNAVLELDAQRVMNVMTHSISDYFQDNSNAADASAQPRNALFVESSIDVLHQCRALGAMNEPTTYSLILQRFYYLEPKNFNLLALAQAEDATFERPEDLVRALGLVFNFEGPRIARHARDFTMVSDCSLHKIMQSFVFPKTSAMRTNVGRAVLSSFHRAASEADPNSNDWRSTAGRLVGMKHTSVPPDWIASVFVKEGLTSVMELLPVLNMEASGAESGCVATSFSMIVMWPTISMSELQRLLHCRNRSAVWESFINERDAIKKFFAVLKEELTLLTRKGIVDPTATPDAYRFWASMRLALVERRWARDDEFEDLEHVIKHRDLKLLKSVPYIAYNGENIVACSRSVRRLWCLLGCADTVHALVSVFQPSGCRSAGWRDPWEADVTPAVDGVKPSLAAKRTLSILLGKRNHEGIAGYFQDQETVARHRYRSFSPVFYNNLMLSGVLDDCGLSTGVFTLPKHRVGRFIATKCLKQSPLRVLIVPRSLGKQFHLAPPNSFYFAGGMTTYHSRAARRLLAMCPGVWNPVEFSQDPYRNSWLPIMMTLGAKDIGSACISGDVLLDLDVPFDAQRPSAPISLEVKRMDLWALLHCVVEQLDGAASSNDDNSGSDNGDNDDDVDSNEEHREAKKMTRAKTILVFDEPLPADQPFIPKFLRVNFPLWVGGIVECTPKKIDEGVKAILQAMEQ